MSVIGSQPLLADLSLDGQSSTTAETTLYNLGSTEIGHSPALYRNWRSGSGVLVSDQDCFPGSAGYVGRRVSFERVFLLCDVHSAHQVAFVMLDLNVGQIWLGE